ncbi:MAG: hypothetical protein JWO10_1976 [Microbacteriaceae bacterium]|nr:hypothetical protein [Microbacteriaceae bacterium]
MNWRATARAAALSPISLWIGFVVVHFWLGMLNLYGRGLPLGDVTIVYKFWMDQAYVAHYWVGIDSPWVYPVGALVPLAIARSLGNSLLASTWLSMVMVLNAVAFAAILGWGRVRGNLSVAWWWLMFLVLLGPIALGRLDSVTVPIAIVGVLFIATRPRLATLILTIGVWIKVWPAALIAAMIVAVKSRWHIAWTAVGASAAVIAIALALGSGLNVFSFVTQQTGRGLQIEAPVTTPWLWRAMSGARDTYIYYDTTILTYQVKGSGVAEVSEIMTPLLGLVLLAIVLLGVLAVRSRAPVGDVLPVLSLSLVTAFIAFNKVGSPQYISWLAVPVILGLATSLAGDGSSFRSPAIMVAVLALLTQAIYPYYYDDLLHLNVVLLIVLSAKNLLLFALLGWAVVRLWQVSRWRFDPETLPGGQPQQVIWPFAPGVQKQPGPQE